MHVKARPPLISLTVIPTIIFFFITVLSILFDRVGISWQRERVPPVLGILTLVGAPVLVFTKVRELTGGRVTRGAILHALEEWRLGGVEPSGAETGGLEKARVVRGQVEPGRAEMTGAETNGLERSQVSQGRVVQAGGEKGHFRRGQVEPEPVDGPIWAMATAGSFLATLPTLLYANPRPPAQQWDPTFHLNGVWSILQFGSASPFGGLSDFYGGRSIFYPMTWHTFTVLFSTSPTVVRAANTSSIVLMIMWVPGVSALASVTTRRRGVILAMPILFGLLLDISADNLTTYNQWFSAMGLAVVPDVTAPAVVLGRHIAGAFEEGTRPLLREFYLNIFPLFGAAGANAAYPSPTFVLTTLPILALLAGSVTALRRAVASGSWLRVILVALIIASATSMPFLTLTTSKICVMGEYPHLGFTWSHVLSHMFIPAPSFTETTSISVIILLQAGLILLDTAYLSGLIILKLRETGGGAPSSPSITKELEREHEKPSDSRSSLNGGQWDNSEPGSHGDLQDDRAIPLTREHPGEWPKTRDWPKAEEPLRPIVSYLTFYMLTLLAYASPGEVQTSLLAPWYSDARRIMGAYGLTMMPLIVLGFDLFASIVHEILPRATGSVQSFSLLQLVPWKVKAALDLVPLTSSGFGVLDSRLAAADYVYDPEKLGKPSMADIAELTMIHRTRLRIPGDFLVLGDPITGTAHTEVLGQYETMFPQLSMTNDGERWQQVFAHRSKDIHIDPEVYKVVCELDITHFYEDEDG